MTLPKSMLLIPLFLLPHTAYCAANASEADQVARIQTMPIAKCEQDLKQLRFIYAHLKALTAAQRQDFLNQVVENIQSQGLQLPPPPAPCSAPDLALEERCGNLSEAKHQCESESQTQ